MSESVDSVPTPREGEEAQQSQNADSGETQNPGQSQPQNTGQTESQSNEHTEATNAEQPHPSDAEHPETVTTENSDEQEICSICTNQITDRTTLNCCSHAFCRTCIRAWVRLHRFCPMCRAQLRGPVSRAVISSGRGGSAATRGRGRGRGVGRGRGRRRRAARRAHFTLPSNI